MHCPNCEDEILKTTLTRQGVEVDACDLCQGVWLERGAINHFHKKPDEFSKRFSEAMTYARPGVKFSPRQSQTRMLQLYYDDQFEIEYCPVSNGIWIDSAELKALNENYPEFNLQPVWDELVQDTPSNLMRLPNLYFHMATALFGTFGVLWAIFYLVVFVSGADAIAAATAASTMMIVHVFLAPWLFRLVVDKAFDVTWIKPGDLPSGVNNFMDKTVQRNNIRYPRIGIVETDIPEMFSFGYTHNHANIVFSRVLLDELGDDELIALLGHELGKIVNRDMTFVTQLQFLPLINRIAFECLRSKRGIAYSIVSSLHYSIDRLLSFFHMTLLRIRILHADRFASEYSNSDKLASLLVKLNYRLIRISEGEQPEKNILYKALGPVGLINISQAVSLAVLAYSDISSRSHEIDTEQVSTALNWDKTNPWSDWFELISATPSLYKRLLYLQDYTEINGNTPWLDVRTSVVQKNWDAFILQYIIYILPYLSGLIIPLYMIAFSVGEHEVSLLDSTGLLLLFLGLVFLFRLVVYYPSNKFSSMAISVLVKNMNVSAIHPVTCEVDGMLLGNIVPGYIQADELFLKDSTGIMLLEHHANQPLLKKMAAMLRDEKHFGKRINISGWYRRLPMPHIEIKTLKLDEEVCINRIPDIKRTFALALSAAGIILLMI